LIFRNHSDSQDNFDYCSCRLPFISFSKFSIYLGNFKSDIFYRQKKKKICGNVCFPIIKWPIAVIHKYWFFSETVILLTRMSFERYLQNYIFLSMTNVQHHKMRKENVKKYFFCWMKESSPSNRTTKFCWVVYICRGIVSAWEQMWNPIRPVHRGYLSYTQPGF
jgi:hypothetical protein